MPPRDGPATPAAFGLDFDFSSATLVRIALCLCIPPSFLRLSLLVYPLSRRWIEVEPRGTNFCMHGVDADAGEDGP